MAVNQGIKALLNPFRFGSRISGFEMKKLEKLPSAYQKFYDEWKSEPKPVHWVPRTEKWERDPKTGVVTQVQNHAIPVKYPHQVHSQIWGGEAVVKGLVKKAKYRSPVTRFWVPRLKEAVLYSEVLDKYFDVIVTDRALRLIDASYGFDSYLLETPACDVMSLAALKVKRRILLALVDKDFAHNDPKKQQELYQKYKKFIIPREEADWIGLSLEEAEAKAIQIEKTAKLAAIQPLKQQYRQELLLSLRAKSEGDGSVDSEEGSSSSSWLSKLNPFQKPANP